MAAKAKNHKTTTKIDGKKCPEMSNNIEMSRQQYFTKQQKVQPTTPLLADHNVGVGDEYILHTDGHACIYR